MLRRPTERELLRSLAAAAESDDSGEELAQLVAEHAGPLASSLGVTVAHLRSICEASPIDRVVKVRVALRKYRERNEESLRRQSQNLAIAAADMLVGLSRWRDQRVDLDHRIVLGGLLADRERKAIRFDVDGRYSVDVLRETLARSKRALRFSDLSCFLDARGLNFRWRNGRGGLVLRSQNVSQFDTSALLHVVFPEQQQQPKSVQHLPPLPLPPSSRSWVGDVLLDLAYL